MKSKLVSLVLVFTFILTNTAALADAAQPLTGVKPDVLREMFGGIDEIDPNALESDLPYNDGTFLSDIREPLYMTDSGGKLFGDHASPSEGQSWSGSLSALTLKSGNVAIGGKSYPLSGDTKLLSAYEGDFDNDGKKDELAVLAAAKTTDSRSLLLLCTAAAKGDTYLNPVIVLYSGTTAFYNDTAEFVNSMTLVCADMDGDGYDEIVTTTPTSGYATKSSDKYVFDKFSGSYLWYLNKENRTESGWKTADAWCSTPINVNNGMNMSYGDCHMGAPGTSASVAAGDIDGDGIDDIVSAISTTNAQYTNYSGNMFYVCYIKGSAVLEDIGVRSLTNRKLLTNYINSEVRNRLYIGTTNGDASGFDVKISDVDGSGKPTVFLSFKQTIHNALPYTGDKMLTPSYYILSFDYNKKTGGFLSSVVYNGGIYHHGWADGQMGGDSINFVYRTKPTDCAPVRIGILKGDFGLSSGKHGYVSSGTILADQKYLSFVRYPDGDSYRYDVKDNGFYTDDSAGYSGEISFRTGDNTYIYKASECIFYNNGINVTDIRTANVCFDGESYKDAALVTAYTTDGKRFDTYFLSRGGSGYGSAKTANGKTAAVIAVPDADGDSIYLKYNKHKFFWADPVIIAALASPPYFDSLPSDMYTNSQTTYGRSRTTSSGSSESFSVSAGAYISTEIKAGGSAAAGVFESEFEAMKSSGLENERMTEVSYTQSFSTSGGEDTVVLTTVAFDAYAYTAYYPGEDGKVSEAPYIVCVPRNSADAIRTASISYDDYLDFRQYAEGVLPDLSDVFTHKIGSPDSYPKDAPSGTHILKDSVIRHQNLSGFPSNTGSQTLTIDITKETTQTTSAGSSVSAKLGGGFESEADDVLGLVDMGTKVTGGSVTEKEHENNRITTNAVGTTFEGTVFGQGDGMNTGGEKTRAEFNWRLLHYVYDFSEGDSFQQFPVITYIVTGVNNPQGVTPTSLTVSPESKAVEQVGPKTEDLVNRITFNAAAPGLSREPYIALEGAPVGMTLDTGGAIASAPFAFNIKINGSVKPGEYPLQLNVGGRLSNTFTVNVTPYTDPIWIETDKTELDFGSMRYKHSSSGAATPSADTQYVTVKNIHTAAVDNLAVYFDDSSLFEVKEPLSATLLAPNSTATVGIAPKKGLSVGTHTGTLTVSNGVTAATLTLKYTVTKPTLPGKPSFEKMHSPTPKPLSLLILAPEDDGGGEMLHYLYTIKGHGDYTDENGGQIWKKSNSTAQSGNEFKINPAGEFEIGKTYQIGVKAVTTAGEGDSAWGEFEVSGPANPPDPVTNVQVYPGDGKITITWDAVNYWGENKYVPSFIWRFYNLWLKSASGDYLDSHMLHNDSYNPNPGTEYTFTGLTNGTEYQIEIYSGSSNDGENPSNGNFGETVYINNITPSADPKKSAPSRPNNFAVKMSYKTAKLTWAAPTVDGGKEITGYKVSKDGGATWTNVGNATEYTFANLVTDSEYDFRVCAVNSMGDGGYAKSVQTAPTNLTAPSGGELTVGYKQLELAWNSVDNATGYQARIDSGEWQDIDTIFYDGKRRYIFQGLENGREYTLYVRAKGEDSTGPVLEQTGAPSSDAAPAIVNPRIEPFNGGAKLYCNAPSGPVIAEYKLDGSYWWRDLKPDGTLITDLTNGKTYTVAASARIDGDNTYRTTAYLTVTPRNTLIGLPGDPTLDAYIGEDYVRLEWEVEETAAAPIDYFIITESYYIYNENGEGDEYNETYIVSRNERTYTLPRRLDTGSYRILVTAVNSVGESSYGDYVNIYPEMVLKGDVRIILPGNHGDAISSPFKLTVTYFYTDENGNPVSETADISADAEWSLKSANDLITWNGETRSINIGKDLPAGVYDATVMAKRSGATFERTVKIIAGSAAAISGAAKTEGGVSVKVDIPKSFGEVVLCITSYDSRGALSGVSTVNVSADTLTDGGVFVPFSFAGSTSAKVMLLESTKTITPLCSSLPITD